MGLLVYTTSGTMPFPSAGETSAQTVAGGGTTNVNRSGNNGYTADSKQLDNDSAMNLNENQNFSGYTKYSFDKYTSNYTSGYNSQYNFVQNQNGWITDFNNSSKTPITGVTNRNEQYARQYSKQNSYDAYNVQEQWGITHIPDEYNLNTNYNTQYTRQNSAAVVSHKSSTISYEKQSTQQSSTKIEPTYKSLNSGSTEDSYTKYTYVLESKPYYYTFETTQTTGTFSFSEELTSSYSTSVNSIKYNDGGTGNFIGVNTSTTKGTTGLQTLPNYVLVKSPSGTIDVAEDVIIWVYEPNESGAASACFKTIDNSAHTYSVKYVTEKISIPFTTVLYSIDTNTNTTSAGTSSSATASFDLPWGAGVIDSSGSAVAPYTVFSPDGQSSTAQIDLGPYQISFVTSNNDHTTSRLSSFNNVFFHDETHIILENEEYVTKEVKIPKVYSTTLASTIPWPVYELTNYSTTGATVNQASSQGSGEDFYYNIWTTWAKTTYWKTGSFRGTSYTGSTTQTAEKASYFSSMVAAYLLPNDSYVSCIYEDIPNGYIGFAGSVAQSKLSSFYGYKSYTTGSSSTGTGKPIVINSANQFHISKHPELFASMRPGYQVIIPKTTSVYVNTSTTGETLYTLIASGVKDLTTSAEFTAYYSTTVKTKFTASSSTSSTYLITGITKKRNNFEVQVGTTSAYGTYKSSTSVNSTGTTKSTASTAYMVSLSEKMSKQFFTSFSADAKYGALGAFNGRGATTVSLGSPLQMLYTLVDSKGGTSKSTTLFDNLKTERTLTIKKNNVMYYELNDLYSSIQADAGAGILYFTTPKYYIPP